jgi:hypothetical protein
MKEKWIKLSEVPRILMPSSHTPITTIYLWRDQRVHLFGKGVLRLCKVIVNSRECVHVTEHFWSFFCCKL